MELMKVTIEIPDHYYLASWANESRIEYQPLDPVKETLASAKEDWVQFSFDMAEIIEKELIKRS